MMYGRGIMRRRLAAVVSAALFLAVIAGQARARAERGGAEPVNVGNTVCPVRGTKIVPAEALTVEYMGKIYNVCSADCAGEFRREPEKYVAIVEDRMREEAGN